MHEYKNGVNRVILITSVIASIALVAILMIFITVVNKKQQKPGTVSLQKQKPHFYPKLVFWGRSAVNLQQNC